MTHDDATMQKLTAADPETHSPNLVAENLAALQALFPELITEGADGVAVNIDVLKALVGDKTVAMPMRNTASTGMANAAPANLLLPPPPAPCALVQKTA